MSKWRVRDPNLDGRKWIAVNSACSHDDAALQYLDAAKVDAADFDDLTTFFLFVRRDKDAERRVKIGISRRDEGDAIVYGFEVRR